MSEISRTGAAPIPLPAQTSSVQASSTSISQPAAPSPAAPPAGTASPAGTGAGAAGNAAGNAAGSPPAASSDAASGARQILDANSSPQPAQADAVRTSEVAEAARSGRAIDAQVAARDGNAVVLRSQSGTTLVVSGNPKLVDFLVPGGAVKLAVQPGTPPSVTILSANGLTLTPPLSALLQSPTPTQMALAVAQPQAAQGGALQPGQLPQPGQVLAATVLPQPAASGQMPQAGVLPEGTQAQVIVKSVALPGGEAAAAAGGRASPLLLESAGAGASAGQMQAVVTGQAANGQTLLRTAQGLLGVSLPQTLPPGTQLTLEMSALVRPAGPPPMQVGPAPLAGVLQRLQGGWPILQQTLDAVRGVNPDLAARMAQALPQANARLAANALHFMAAAAMGSAQVWLGAEAAQALKEAGRGDLLKKLDDDFRDLGRLNQRGGDQDWQALTMPMLVQGKVEAVQIFMRRRKDPRSKQKQTRFLIDFNLESSGLVQFDGFFSDHRLDLILRVEHEFGPAFKVDVQQIFDDALAITGMTGTLQFREREAPIPWPSPELAPRGPSQQLTV